MKRIIKTKIIVIFALIIFANTPFVALAADMWAETPDISKDKEDHDVNISGPARFVNNFNPEMYAETPGLDSVAAGQEEEFLEEMFIAEE